MSMIPLRKRQSGAVAIMTALSLLILIGFIALVVDLGYLYTRKTELQNAADAAALAGARELNGTAAGVTAAAAQAIALANANNSDLGATPVVITDANIEFGPDPSGPWSSVAAASASDAVAADKFFIKVDSSGIAQGARPTWFMSVMSAGASTYTFGLAVAGRTVCEALPMFVCARTAGVAPNYGFVRGTSYLLVRSPSGSSIGPGNVGWLDPVPPGAPSLIPPGTSALREILCRGQGYCISPGTYSSRTEPSLPNNMRALNTRFGIYETGTFNDAEHKQACPADTNVKEYLYTGPANPPMEMVVDWLTTSPLLEQGLTPDEVVDGSGNPKVVHWAAARPGASDTPTVTGNYPVAGSGSAGEFSGTPYGQTAGSYFQAPPSTLNGDPVASEAGRRVITIGVASNCGDPGLNGNGAAVNIVAFARFLMQVTADTTGSNKGFYGEFLNTVSTPPVVVPEIKLYR